MTGASVSPNRENTVKQRDQPPLGGRVNRRPSCILTGVGSPFPIAFILGAGVVALWIDVRFPKLAPQSIVRRMLAACVAFVLLQAAPLVTTSALAAYASLFGGLLPSFVAVFVTAIWLLRAMRDAQPS
jgi:hypothetical protein